jgi:hypothetical protein
MSSESVERPKVTLVDKRLAAGSRILDRLHFDLLEEVWLIGPPSILITPQSPVDYTTEAWRAQWHVSAKRLLIDKISHSFGKIYYHFREGGCDSGSRMFRDSQKAHEEVVRHNASAFAKIHFCHRQDLTACGMPANTTRIVTSYRWSGVTCPGCIKKKPATESLNSDPR